MPAPLTKPNRDAFEKDYMSLTNAEVCEKYHIAPGTMRAWMKYFGITKKSTRRTLSVGDVVGSWTIIERLYTNKYGSIRWRVQCSCGNIRTKATGHIIAAETIGHTCGHNKWTGHKDLPGKYWKGIVQKARLRGISVDVSVIDAWNLFEAQGGRCAMTGVALKFGTGQTASLDRKDSSLGYTSENLQWVHKRINMMKNKLDVNEFYDWCCRVAEHSKTRAAA